MATSGSVAQERMLTLVRSNTKCVAGMLRAAVVPHRGLRLDHRFNQHPLRVRGWRGLAVVGVTDRAEMDAVVAERDT